MLKNIGLLTFALAAFTHTPAIANGSSSSESKLPSQPSPFSSSSDHPIRLEVLRPNVRSPATLHLDQPNPAAGVRAPLPMLANPLERITISLDALAFALTYIEQTNDSIPDVSQPIIPESEFKVSVQHALSNAEPHSPIWAISKLLRDAFLLENKTHLMNIAFMFYQGFHLQVPLPNGEMIDFQIQKKEDVAVNLLCKATSESNAAKLLYCAYTKNLEGFKEIASKLQHIEIERKKRIDTQIKAAAQKGAALFTLVGGIYYTYMNSHHAHSFKIMTTEQGAPLAIIGAIVGKIYNIIYHRWCTKGQDQYTLKETLLAGQDLIPDSIRQRFQNINADAIIARIGGIRDNTVETAEAFIREFPISSEVASQSNLLGMTKFIRNPDINLEELTPENIATMFHLFMEHASINLEVILKQTMNAPVTPTSEPVRN